MLTISPSNVQMLSCHRKFSALAVNRHFAGNKSQSPTLRFGIGLHEVLRLCYDPAMPGLLPRQDELPLYIRAAFMAKAYRDEEQRETDMMRAHRLAHNYMMQDEEAHFTTGVECHGKYAIEIDGEAVYEVSARLDRIIEMPNGVYRSRLYDRH